MADGITAGWMRDQLAHVEPHRTVGVRIDGKVYRATDSYYDIGDGYYVIEAVEVEAISTVGKFNSGDPNDRWQMYTPEGNAAMQSAFNALARDLRSGQINWHQLGDAYEYVMVEVDGAGHGECFDTEPRCAMKDALDEVLDELGYKPLEF